MTRCGICKRLGGAGEIGRVCGANGCQGLVGLVGVQIGQMLDITAPKNVHVQISDDRKVLWVNVEGSCVLRCCKIQLLELFIPRHLLE